MLVGHYASYYAVDFYERWLFNYASEFVSIFFILGGYGLYFSLARSWKDSDGSGNVRELLAFYARRASRIYPLYWLSLTITPFFFSEYQAHLHEFSLNTLAIYLAFPLVAAPGIYWFIPALVQCYLAAPLCFWLIRKLGLWRYLALAGLATLLFFIISLKLVGFSGLAHVDPLAVSYRGFFLGNVLLLALGMTIPLLINRYREDISSLTLTLASLTLFLASVYIIRFPHLLFPRSFLFLTPVFLWGGFLFCMFFIATRPPLLFGRAITYTGRSSYALYLFHRPAYALLVLIGVITAGSLASVIYTALLMPAIVAACYWLERYSLRISALIERALITPVDKPGGERTAGNLEPVRVQPAED